MYVFHGRISTLFFGISTVHYVSSDKTRTRELVMSNNVETGKTSLCLRRTTEVLSSRNVIFEFRARESARERETERRRNLEKSLLPITESTGEKRFLCSSSPVSRFLSKSV